MFGIWDDFGYFDKGKLLQDEFHGKLLYIN